jgi:hypothetical protein
MVGLEGHCRPQIYLARVSPIHPSLLVLDSATSLPFLLLQPIVFVVVKNMFDQLSMVTCDCSVATVFDCIYFYI